MLEGIPGVLALVRTLTLSAQPLLKVAVGALAELVLVGLNAAALVGHTLGMVVALVALVVTLLPVALLIEVQRALAALAGTRALAALAGMKATVLLILDAMGLVVLVAAVPVGTTVQPVRQRVAAAAAVLVFWGKDAVAMAAWAAQMDTPIQPTKQMWLVKAVLAAQIL